MDDSPLAIEETRRVLEEGGLEVMCACNLEELTGVDPTGADLILMDVRMPEAYGDDVASWLRGAHRVTAPILLFSDLSDAELAARAREAGIEGYISKRSALSGVVARVAEVLGLSPPERPRVRERLMHVLPRFVATARQRLAHVRALAATDLMANASAIAGEMHTQCGEAALMGADDLAGAAEAVRREVRSGAPDGAGFSARLDSLAGAIDVLAAGMSVKGEPPPPAPAGRRILLVDDSDFFRTTLRALLEEDSHQVIEASSLAMGRELLARAGAVHLVILDVHLGDGNGLDLIPEARALVPSARIMVLSGSEPETPVTSADLTLTKAVELGTLLAEIEHLLM
jgi:DNA-binding NarL/FixJ family response regulator